MAEDYPQLGRYQVIDRIAAGGMAEVFLAKAVGAMGFQRLVAVKLIHANFTRDEEFVKMFIDEARIAMHLSHRNIVQVFDLDKVAGTYFIGMEYVHGVNLYDVYERLAERGRWVDPPLALYLIAEVCTGLHFAHTRSDAAGQPLTIIHRDISPQNVLLSFEGEVKITDFGIATAAQRLHQTAAGIVKGKYAYMAPERLQEQPIDARVDVFSTGVLLYELLTGENPFAGNSAVETIENVLHKDVPAPSRLGARVTRDLDEICLKAIARDPRDRFTDAEAFGEALTEYAMDLTLARRDMAGGDAAVAQLLQDLYPERAGRQPTAAPVGSIVIPGLEEGISSVSEPAPAAPEDDNDDFDAPTVLRMDAVTGLEDIPTPRAAQSGPTTDEAIEAPGAPTTPTAIPDAHPMPEAFADVPPPADSEDPFAPTVRSKRSVQVVAPVVPQVSPSRSPVSGHRNLSPQRARPTPAEVRAQASSSSHSALVVPVSPTRQDNSVARRLNTLAVVLLVVAVAIVVAAAVLRRNQMLADVELVVRTQPPGATVFVNGQRAPRRTPLEQAVLAGQPVVVDLELAGHRSVRRKVTPQRGERVVVDETLRPIEGQLVVIPTPPEAAVRVDGQKKGKGKVQVNGLPLDRPVEVEVALKGYVTFKQALTLTVTSPQQTLAVPLAPQPKANRAARTRKVRLVAPNGKWATVYFDGRNLGTTPVEAALPLGAVRLRVRNDETKLNKEIRIRVPRGGSNRIPLPL